MAIAQKDKRPPKQDEEEEHDEAEAAPEGDEHALATPESDALERAEGGDDAAKGDAEPEEEEAAAQLGADRYVLAGFFAAALMGAYVLGRAFAAGWMTLANKDYFNQNFPRLAAVADDEKATYGFVVGAIAAFIIAFTTYRRQDVRTWCDDVASELAKVVWPTKKEVQSNTFIVIIASTTATVYLALLDRLWAFVTNIVYGGDGS